MADDDTQAQAQAQDAADSSDGTQNTETQGEQERRFTREELARAIARERKRDREQWEREAEEARKQAQMSAEERLKAELEAERSRTQQAVQMAQQTKIEAAVMFAASGLGIVDPDAAYQLMDKSEVVVDDAGKVQGVKEALDALLKAKPYLKGEQGQRAAGGIPASPRGQAAPIPSREQLIAEEKERRRRTYGGF